MKVSGNPYSSAQDAVLDALAKTLELTQAQADKMLRFDWPDGESAKFDLGPNDNVIYLRITETPLQGSGYLNRRAKEAKTGFVIESDMHIGLRCDAVIYGPDGFKNAQLFYAAFLGEEASSFLRTAGMAPVPHEALPTHMPENVNGVWYDRYDAGINFYMLVSFTHNVGAADQLPEINIQKG